MSKPWFTWSLALGIRPIHPNGWIATGSWILVEALLGSIAIGLLATHPIVEAMAAVAFVATGVGFFALVWSRFEKKYD